MTTASSLRDVPLSWLHLSDFHIGKDGFAQRQILEKIIEEVNATIRNWRAPDFIFLTGDLSNRGKPDEFEVLNQKLIEPLVELLGLDYTSRIFIVPGNHDVDRSMARAVKRIGVLEDIEEFLDPSEEGLEVRLPLLPRFSAFDSFDWTIENGKWVCSVEGVLSRRIKVQALEVGILCINTAWFCGGDGEQHNLALGVNLMEQGLKDLAGCSPIIVLGHHPIDWMLPREAKKMSALLASHQAIYLHGHLHKTEGGVANFGNKSFTVLQAGCSFYAREDEKWRTRILWTGFDPVTKTPLVRPKKWMNDSMEWILDSEAFPEEQRAPDSDYWVIGRTSAQVAAIRAGAAQAAREVKEVALPEGWHYISPEFIREHTLGTTDERLLQYFDGRLPVWEDILSGRIPERSIVSDVVKAISDGLASGASQLTLLMGAGGEGKSTAFLQAVVKLSRLNPTGINIIWRSNSERPLPPELIRVISQSKDKWIIVSDEADSLANGVYNGLRANPGHKNIHFLLTCRDTDWNEGGGDTHQWNSVISLVLRIIRGLENKDAEAIVDAWSSCGSRGLGKLSGLDRTVAVHKLLDAAQQEAINVDGAFLGAMLRVRVGLALKDHVAQLLARLERRDIAGSGGNSLLHAFALIAVPHAANILFLSRAVLAKALDLDDARLRKRVLGPLGDEAAADALGKFILTRHRAIAEAAVEIFAKSPLIDRDDILVQLVRAALLANEEGKLVLNFSSWRYLSGRMFDEGYEALGIKLAVAACKADPRNSYLTVKLAQLFRQVGQVENSVKVFRNQQYKADGNRAFFTEWATCEGYMGNSALGAWLNALSMADEADLRPPDIKDMCRGFVGCSVSFVSLYERYTNDDFLVAALASIQLGYRIPRLPADSKGMLDEQYDKARLLGAKFSSLESAFKNFGVGIRLIFDRLEAPLDESLAKEGKLTFSYVQETLKINV